LIVPVNRWRVAVVNVTILLAPCVLTVARFACAALMKPGGVSQIWTCRSATLAGAGATASLPPMFHALVPLTS